MKIRFTNSIIGRLRFIGILEGISYLFLLGVALPLKHYFGQKSIMKPAGWIHGSLFLALMAFLAIAVIKRKITIKTAVVYFISSLLPFGTFVADNRLLKQEVAAQ